MLRFLTLAVFALFLLAPFANSADADADAFLEKVAAVLARAVKADKIDAEDARRVYDAIVDKVEAIEEKLEDCRKQRPDEAKDDDDAKTRGLVADDDKTRGRGKDLDDAKDDLKAALRKAKADRKCEKAKARLDRYVAKLKKAVARLRCSVEKAQRKWAGVLRKVASKLDETTLARLKAYGEDLKEAVENDRISKREAFDLFVTAVRKALAAQ